MNLENDDEARIVQKVIELAAQIGGVSPAQVTLESNFVNDLSYDSLEDVELAMAIEDEFEISIADEDLTQFKTVGDVVDHLLKRRPDSAGKR